MTRRTVSVDGRSGRLLAHALERGGTPGVAEYLDRELAMWTPAPVSLREVAVWARERRLAELLKSEWSEGERARLLDGLGARLNALGRRVEALATAQEAVEISRKLATERPDACLPDLATSIDNMGRVLSNMGRREDARSAKQEAARTRRKVAVPPQTAHAVKATQIRPWPG